ncbi:MAG TPA: hypothetical protein DCR44_05620 [Acholeplasmatales bacterium]|nr:hypothetical protein [Acholeplasmatales bacterium]
MLNRKRYIIVLVVLGVASVSAAVINAIYGKQEYWLWILLVVMTVWTVLRTRVYAPLQVFGTKFTMLVDYDLDIEEACRLAKLGADNAPTARVKEIYGMYYAMSLYYKGDYEAAVRAFNQIDMKKLDGVYHILIVAFIAYSEFELGNADAFDAAVERLHGIKTGIPAKYQNYAANYLEILEAMGKLSDDPEAYRAMMEKHFSRDDGYISTRLIHNYRIALYYKEIGDVAEMDKQLAFVIANGKDHHTALQAQKLFQGTVNVEDYVIRDSIEEVQPADETAQIETKEPDTDDGEDDQPEGV